MSKTKMYVTLMITIVVSLSTSGIAWGNTQDLLATTVPATACQPINSSQDNLVFLSNAAWVFRGTNTGTVTFYCPLTVNAWTVSNNTNDNDISFFRVYYRDTDGTGTAARVTALLTFRRFDGLFGVGSTWDSNSSSFTGNTFAIHDVTHDLRSMAVYSFLVTLRRTNTNENPAFSGIDFAPIPVP